MLGRMIIAVAWVALSAQAWATPFFTQDPRTLPKGVWRVEKHMLLLNSDESLVDGDEVSLVSGERFSSLTIESRVRYGVTDRLTVFADLPYVRRSLDTSNGEQTNSGFGDVFVLAKWKVHDSRAARTRAAVVAATKLDTGEYRNLAPELALGTGQTNWIVGGLGEKQAGPNTWYASALYVMTGSRTDTDTNPGQVVMLNGAVEHRIGQSRYNLVGELNYSHQGRSEVSGQTVGASGSTILNAAGGFQYSRPRKNGRMLVIETELQVPVRKDGFVRDLPEYLWYLGGWMTL